MDKDMRHFVVFRVPEDLWQTEDFNSADLGDWIEQHTLEGKPCVVIGETDCRHHYLILGFTTHSDRDEMVKYLRTIPFVEIAFMDAG